MVSIVIIYVRYNSQLKMIRKFRLESRENMEKLNYAENLSSQYKNMKTGRDSHTPAATSFAQTQSKVTFNLVLPCIRGLRAELCELKEREIQLLDGKTFTAALEKRLSKHDTTQLFTLSAVFDPRWRLMWATREEAVDLR